MSQQPDPYAPQPGYVAYDPVTGQPLQVYGQQPPWAGQPAPAYLAYPPGYGLIPPGYVALPPARRSGSALSAAVLQFVQAGLLAFAVLSLLTGAELARSGARFGTMTGELTITAVVTLAVMGLLIAGGVRMLANRVELTWLACGASLAMSVYWAIRLVGEDTINGGWGMLVMLYSVMPIIALSQIPTVKRWVAQRSGQL